MIDRRFSSNGLLDLARERAVPVDGGFYLERPVEFFFDHFSLMWTGSVMIHASVIEQTGRFDETLTYGEDLKYWYQAALSNMVPTMVSMAAGFGSNQTGTPLTDERISKRPSTPSEATATRREAGDTDNILIHHRGRFYDRRLAPVAPDAVPSDGRVILAIDPALSLVDAIAVRQRKVYFLDTSTVYYRQHGDSLTADTEKFLEGTEGVYREFLRDKGFSEYRTKANRRLALALNASSYYYRKKKKFLVATRLAARSILAEPSNTQSWRNLSATVLRVS